MLVRTGAPGNCRAEPVPTTLLPLTLWPQGHWRGSLPLPLLGVLAFLLVFACCGIAYSLSAFLGHRECLFPYPFLRTGKTPEPLALERQKVPGQVVGGSDTLLRSRGPVLYLVFLLSNLFSGCSLHREQ